MTELKVLFDHQIFDAQPHGGISRYHFELLKGLSKQMDVRPRVGMGYSSNSYLNNGECSDLFTDPSRTLIALDGMIKRVLGSKEGSTGLFGRGLRVLSGNRSRSVKALRDGDFGVFHPTYYDPYFLPLIGDAPFVLTLHDFMPERFASGPEWTELIEWKRELVERADHVIAVSESTKRDAVELLGTTPSKITVIYHGSSLHAPAVKVDLPNVPDKYLLFVGKREWYKNFDFLISALSPVFRTDPDLHLVCAGGGAFTSKEIKAIRESGIEGKVHFIPAGDDKLASLYANALAFTYPTQYEGFGIPVLEAMSCGCPVVTTNASALPEVGGDAVRYFPANDENGFREALAPLLVRSEEREMIRLNGLEQAFRFSWEKTVMETRKVYESLL